MTRLAPSLQILRYLSHRLLAGLIDLGVMTGLQFGIAGSANALFPPTHPGHHFSAEGLILFGVFSPLAWFLYAVLPLTRTGATLGKEIVGIRVVGRNGQKPSLLQAFMRESAGRWLNAMVLNLGLLFVFWDRDRQALHDMVADTFVVWRKNRGHFS
ncbi:MAG: RDD family protein [Meiothermus sp.]|uniref:RDD family protein n=1 Tax=Meiothermus sp. TaxID=1955249 RepID=UPI0025E8B629|nr:RDD family protein [Meiothermus sp.]MCS7067931.1 RDD family protein [Meiothermus sp.]MCX7600956.1 RDD family protein [Meiothermus sp.]MDW8426683.1 RDD family protein [Meiothermus sp.]